MKETVASRLATLVDATIRCNTRGSLEAVQRHAVSIHDIERERLPSGAGIDSGVKLDFTKSNRQKLVFSVPYHHMSDDGYYTHWQTYIATVTPTFQGIDVHVTCPGACCDAITKDTADYIGECVHQSLTEYYQVGG